MTPRLIRRLALASVLVFTVGVLRGFDVALIVTLCLAVMEVEPYVP